MNGTKYHDELVFRTTGCSSLKLFIRPYASLSEYLTELGVVVQSFVPVQEFFQVNMRFWWMLDSKA